MKMNCFIVLDAGSKLRCQKGWFLQKLTGNNLPEACLLVSESLR